MARQGYGDWVVREVHRSGCVKAPRKPQGLSEEPLRGQPWRTELRWKPSSSGDNFSFF